ncbi:hypothetical protein EVAR_35751_1 [Eumeta japonica]|uniref:Uncharacterized protein n=1 Tax=Eumeta variegata TaxID=151549 RepID=A0A4C1VG90_EUMVA|nr:hypothetical protein EVAR_35751_1 [Eumeta japonica]
MQVAPTTARPSDHQEYGLIQILRVRQRFLYSEEFAPTGDVAYALVHVGGGQPLDSSCLRDGLMRRMAQLLNGAMFCTEHRYYGQSLPARTAGGAQLSALIWIFTHVKPLVWDVVNSSRPALGQCGGFKFRVPKRVITIL